MKNRIRKKRNHKLQHYMAVVLKPVQLLQILPLQWICLCSTNPELACLAAGSKKKVPLKIKGKLYKE